MLQLSYSQLKLFLSCPLEYYYKYVLKLPEKDTETKWTDFGKGVHEVLEDYYSQKNIDWQKNLIDKYEKYNLKDRMNFDLFKKNVMNGISLGIEPTHLEKKFLIDVTNQITFLGYMDVLNIEDDYILDWKTGKYSKDKEDDYKSQLLCYAWMFYRTYNRVPQICSLFFTEAGHKIDFTFTEEQIIKFENFVKVKAFEIIRKKALDKKAHLWGNELGYFSGYHYLNNLEELSFTIEIRNNYCFLSGAISPLLIEGLDRETRFDLPNKHFIQKAVMEKRGYIKDIDEIGRVHLFDKRLCKFSLGLISKVKDIINQYCEYKKAKANINIIDLRNQNVHNNKLNLPDKLLTEKELREYQLSAISSFLRSEGLGFLEVATGGGKTLITAEIIRRLNTKTLWIIDKKELLNQTKEEFEKVLGVEIGVIGEGKFEPKDITVATIQSLNVKVKNMEPITLKYLSSINFAIVDESHHSSCESYSNVFKALVNTKYRLGTTATAQRDDGKEPVMFSLLGPILYSIKSDELIDKGFLVKPKIKFYEVIEKLGKSESYSDEYSIGIAENSERNELITRIVREHIDKKILIIVKLVNHGTYLNEKIENSFYIHGSLDNNLRKQYFDNFKLCKKGILIATSSIASEGLDIPDLQMIINVSANKSDVKSIQALGRILRKIEGKEEAHYIDFFDKGRFGRKHSWARINIFKEQGYEVEIK